MCFCLPCVGATGVGAYKISKAADKLTGGKSNEPAVEPAFVTEAKLKWNLHKAGKPRSGELPATSFAGDASSSADRKRWVRGSTRKANKQAAQSKARLRELAEQQRQASDRRDSTDKKRSGRWFG